MKKIIGIKEKLSHFNPDVGKEAEEHLPTFQQMFVSVLGGSPAENGEQAIAMYQFGAKIKDNAGTDMEVEDAEFKLLKEKCQKNALGWVAHYYAQVLIKLKSSDEVKS